MQTNKFFNDEKALAKFNDTISAEALYNRTGHHEYVTGLIKRFPLDEYGLHMQVELRDGRLITTFLGKIAHSFLCAIQPHTPSVDAAFMDLSELIGIPVLFEIQKAEECDVQYHTVYGMLAPEVAGDDSGFRCHSFSFDADA